jgi:hemin uptake protein HemP
MRLTGMRLSAQPITKMRMQSGQLVGGQHALILLQQTGQRYG